VGGGRLVNVLAEVAAVVFFQFLRERDVFGPGGVADELHQQQGHDRRLQGVPRESFTKGENLLHREFERGAL
jgi:hypothetical protein